MAGPGGQGAAVALLIPALATLADGSNVTVDTSYPFEDTVTVSCSPANAAFPLHIRVPSWATRATLNGVPVPAGEFAAQSCVPSGKNTFVLALAPEIVVEEWASDRHGGVATETAFSVVRGPLLYSYPIEHNFTTYGRHFGSGDAASNDYYLQPTAQWNYGLAIDRQKPPSASLHFARGEGYKEGAPPFNRTGPLSISVQARLLPGWGLSKNSAAPPPRSPACVGANSDCGGAVTLKLVPHGYTELRIGEWPLA